MTFLHHHGDSQLLRECWQEMQGCRAGSLPPGLDSSCFLRLAGTLAFAECPWGSFLGSGARDQQPDQGSSAETPGQVKRAPRKGGVDARYSALILQLC